MNIINSTEVLQIFTNKLKIAHDIVIMHRFTHLINDILHVEAFYNATLHTKLQIRHALHYTLLTQNT